MLCCNRPVQALVQGPVCYFVCVCPCSGVVGFLSRLVLPQLPSGALRCGVCVFHGAVCGPVLLLVWSGPVRSGHTMRPLHVDCPGALRGPGAAFVRGPRACQAAANFI
jgi:hypothetical protein